IWENVGLITLGQDGGQAPGGERPYWQPDTDCGKHHLCRGLLQDKWKIRGWLLWSAKRGNERTVKRPGELGSRRERHLLLWARLSCKHSNYYVDVLFTPVARGTHQSRPPRRWGATVATIIA